MPTIARRLPAVVLVLTALIGAVRAEDPPLPDFRLGTRVVPILLLTRSDVREDLGLTPVQARSAEATVRECWLAAEALKGKPNAEARPGREAIDRKMFGWIETELTESQRERLVQIDLQWEGPSALISRPIVASTLGLAEEQKATIRGAVKARDAARQRSGGFDPEAEARLGSTALGCLSAEQRNIWLSLMGRVFHPKPLTANRRSAETASK